jgi:thiosulfate/3-mercaptopyruvate sulfurtransferase
MKKTKIYYYQILPVLIVLSVAGLSVRCVKKERAAEPWTESQLLAPADLAKMLGGPKDQQPVIICVGPGAVIKNSIDTGPAKDSLNLGRLRQQLVKLSRDGSVVIYCGCCPFEHCPNIRPAFSLLNEMKFTHQKLLNIEHNIKTDWISKGYPVSPQP